MMTGLVASGPRRRMTAFFWRAVTPLFVGLPSIADSFWKAQDMVFHLISLDLRCLYYERRSKSFKKDRFFSNIQFIVWGWRRHPIDAKFLWHMSNSLRIIQKKIQNIPFIILGVASKKHSKNGPKNRFLAINRPLINQSTCAFSML